MTANLQTGLQTTEFETPLSGAKKLKKSFSKAFNSLGRIGKALMFPIAVLPIAAIFLRIGAQIPGTTDFSKFMQNLLLVGGNVVFNNLYLLFGVGVAFGLTKDNRGEAALVGLLVVVGMSMMLGTANGGADFTNIIYGKIDFPIPEIDALRSGRYGLLGFANSTALAAASDQFVIDSAKTSLTGFYRIFGTSYNSILATNVLNGIISGGLVAYIYNRYAGIELPKVLGFFSGRRLVPVLAIIAVLGFGILWAIVFPWVGYVLFLFADALGAATGDRYANAAISGVYATLNRLLIPFGLHHVPNTLFWFVLGSHDAVDPTIGTVYGDINVFLSGVALGNNGGTFQTGFFPIMMFGLPAMAFSFYKTADNQVQAKRVLSLFGPLALVSFLTGITEPIEFAFMFVSPLFYLAYALLSGVAAFTINLFGIQLGFGFSAGLFDYLLSFPKSLEIIAANKTGAEAVFANPAWLLVVGPIFAVIYYFGSKFLIKKLNLHTPGRGAGQILEDDIGAATISSGGQLSLRAKKIVTGLGGWNNITNYQNCATRLRYDVKDVSLVNESMIKSANVLGFQKVASQMQVIIGIGVEALNDEISGNIGADLSFAATSPAQTQITTENVVKNNSLPFTFKSPLAGKVVSLSDIGDDAFSAMGKGVAIIPTDHDVAVRTKTLIEMGFKTGHAYAIDQNGIKILIHLGLNTSQLLSDEKLANKIFVSDYKDATNISVNANTHLTQFNLEEAKLNNFDITSPIIVLNENEGISDIKIIPEIGSDIKIGDSLFVIS